MPQPEQTDNTAGSQQTSAVTGNHWVYDLLLIGILLLGAYFRFTGIAWDEIEYLHPDERFLAMVESQIRPVASLSEYFDTATSSLNPNNHDFGFFVYGTLPIFITRYIAEWLGMTTYGDIALVGRPLSGIFDLLTILIMYAAVSKVYDRRIGLLAAAFSSLAVLQIQLSHFFTVDIFLNFFIWLGLFFAVQVATARRTGRAIQPERPPKDVGLPEGAAGWPAARAESVHAQAVASRLSPGRTLSAIWRHPVLWPTLLFGAALGLATASKISAAPLAVMLPLAGAIYLSGLKPRERIQELVALGILMVAAALLSMVVFRIFQPYAFTGPGFFDFLPSQHWIDNLRSLQGQTRPSTGFPPSIQWFDRPLWFSGMNLITWGAGPVLGILAWAGFPWVGWRIWRGDWRQHLLLWSWVLIFFVWQSFNSNPTMRYQLPVYPGLAAFAAWAVIRLWDLGAAGQKRLRQHPWLRPSTEAAGQPQQAERDVLPGAALPPRPAAGSAQILFRSAAVGIGVLAVLSTGLYAFAFTRIYTREVTRIEASRWFFQNFPGPVNLQIQSSAGAYQQPLPVPQGASIDVATPLSLVFRARETGSLQNLTLAHLVGDAGDRRLIFTLRRAMNTPVLAEGILNYRTGERRGVPPVELSEPVALVEGETYLLEIRQEFGPGPAVLQGSIIANETSWDDPVPRRMDDYDPFGGIYEGLNLELYWEDNPDKLERMLAILEQSDVIVITSSRQWGSLTRLPQKWPIVSTYYRNLIGCPGERSVEWCYNVAREGMFSGDLGFDLVKVFQSDPTLGRFTINDQFSEEAFTVYDHPKVFIFQKNERFDPAQARAILSAAGFGVAGEISEIRPQVVGQAGPTKSLLLPADRLQDQQSAGTWSDFFNPDGLLNRFQPLAVIAWYLALALVGWAVFPILFLTFPGLSDRGYAFGRIAGLLVLSYLVWLAGSMGIPFNRALIGLAFLFLAGFAVLLAISNRQLLLAQLRKNLNSILIVEGLFLAFFLFLLVVRVGNPDLWHPWKGGEKPMDFSYFNAVLKSETFPPYDPWFAGGYINYYYYGFVYVGVLTKWLGIIPSMAYNLILPSLYAMLAVGAYSIGFNLVRSLLHGEKREPVGPAIARDAEQAGLRSTWKLPVAVRPVRLLSHLSGVAAALFVTTLGNLGTVEMIYQGWQRIAAPPEAVLEETFFLTRWIWGLRGFFKIIGGDTLPYGIADWYWNPSRAIPAPNDVEPITEFPFFTFLYADLHAHMLALPITVLVLGWVVSVILAKGRWSGWLAGLLGLLIGAIAIGALRPTNTWDFPTYLALGALALGYTRFRYVWADTRRSRLVPGWLIGLISAALSMLGLAALSWFLYQPYTQWYALGYTETNIWQGTHTPFGAYLTHWGLFLFLILSWMLWETRQWMAQTPVSALRGLMRFRATILVGLVVLLIWIMGLFLVLDVKIGWFVLPVALWAGILMIRPGIGDDRRLILFLIGTSLVLSLTVEVVVLSGDIGRMNTVFKFYLQVWTLLAVSAAAGLGALGAALRDWNPGWRAAWQITLAALFLGALLYPLLGSVAKVGDRMSESAPISLDGMAYMPFSEYHDQGSQMQLGQDYRAIRWMQENIPGTPVIVEAQIPEYRWGSRYSIYTGLPAVLGWNWHQRQQRTGHDSDVWARATEITQFYSSGDREAVREFLSQYDVRYIVVGQVERAYYEEYGIAKFEQWEGDLWREVFRDGETVIYEVLEAALRGG